MPQSTPGPTTAKMTARAIAGVATSAGFRGNQLRVAVAVALAESGGNPAARGDVTIQSATWGPSIGLWQIRSLKAETGKGTPRDANALRDPLFNARAAFTISKGGTDFGPWSVFNSKAYLLYLPAATAGVNASAGDTGVDPGSTGIGGVIGDVAGGVTDTASAVAEAVKFPMKVTAWISDRNNIVRMIKVVVGVGLVGIGLYVVARPVQKQAQDIAKGLVGVASTTRGKGAAKPAPKPAPPASTPAGP